MKIKRSHLLALVLVALAWLFNCGGEPIFTNMERNSLTVVIKGTYESNGAVGPWGFSKITDADSVYLVGTGSDSDPTALMVDIAEMRLINDSGEDIKFSNIRQGFTAPMAGSPFFDGTGIYLDCDDATTGYYAYVLIYFRKMIFDGATRYYPSSTGWQVEKTETTTFFENEVNGSNFNGSMVATHVDSRTYNASIVNRVFPMTIPIVGGMILKRNEEQVLEIRLPIKRLIKLYETELYAANGYRVVHYYAPSDWLRNKKAGESLMGGNIPAIARSYVVGQTGSISITGAAGNMVIAVPAAGTSAYEKSSNLSSRALYGGYDCDVPQYPGLGGTTVENFVDYYLGVENFIEDWNINMSAGTACPSFDQYSSNWTNYDSDAWAYTVAPLAVYSTGSATINNVPPGTYYLYRLAYPVFGQLVNNGTTFTGPASPTNPITVVAGSVTSVTF